MDLFKFAARGMRAQAAIDRLCRTDGPQTSKDAAEKMVVSGELEKQEQEVYKAIKRYAAYGFNDFTTKDITSWIKGVSWDKAYDICRKRFSGLERKGKIELVWIGYDDNNSRNIYKRREGCRVFRLK